MKSTTRTVLAGALGFFVGFGSDLTSYLQGIEDLGGNWSDISPIRVASLVMTALVSAAGALMLLLADPPDGKRLVARTTAPVETGTRRIRPTHDLGALTR